MKIIKKCPRCNCDTIILEDGFERERIYIKGKKVREKTNNLPKRTRCANFHCFHIIGEWYT